MFQMRVQKKVSSALGMCSAADFLDCEEIRNHRRLPRNHHC